MGGVRVKFCSECETMLMPQEKGKHTWLVCPDCGHYKKLKEEDGYRFGEKKEKEESKVAVIEKEKKRKIKEPDYDIDTDAYAEIYEESY